MNRGDVETRSAQGEWQWELAMLCIMGERHSRGDSKGAAGDGKGKMLERAAVDVRGRAVCVGIGLGGANKYQVSRRAKPGVLYSGTSQAS